MARKGCGGGVSTPPRSAAILCQPPHLRWWQDGDLLCRSGGQTREGGVGEEEDHGIEEGISHFHSSSSECLLRRETDREGAGGVLVTSLPHMPHMHHACTRNSPTNTNLACSCTRHQNNSVCAHVHVCDTHL